MRTIEDLIAIVVPMAADVAAIKSQMSNVLSAMPEKDGNKDFFGHRVDHEDLREGRVERRKVVSTLKSKLIEYAIIFAIVVLAGNLHLALQLLGLVAP